MKILPYPKEIEIQMRNFYHSLSEKDRRRYAAIEAAKLGHGGDTYIRHILHCDNRTLSRGKQELLSDLSAEDNRIRQAGGGRKPVIGNMEGLEAAFLEVLQNNTAGSPMDETVKWTQLSRPAIAEKLQQRGYNVSVSVVKKLLKKHHFRPRKAFKVEAGKNNIPHRDEQFKNIERLKQQYTDAGNPVLSMDVKKKN